MSQRELEQELCRATGESLGTIRHRGFGLERPLEDDDGPTIYQLPQVVDWDAVEERRRAA